MLSSYYIFKEEKMNRNLFIQLTNKASETINKRELRQNIIRLATTDRIENIPNVHPELIVAIEELAELQKEVTKYIRGRGDQVGLTEEIADAIIGILYIQTICGIETNDIYKAMNVKHDRIKWLLSERKEKDKDERRVGESDRDL